MYRKIPPPFLSRSRPKRLLKLFMQNSPIGKLLFNCVSIIIRISILSENWYLTVLLSIFVRRYLKLSFSSLVAFWSLVSDVYTSSDCVGVEGKSLLFTKFSVGPHLYFKTKLSKFLPLLSDPFLFRCSLLLLNSALRLMFLWVMKSNLASLDILKKFIIDIQGFITGVAVL